MSVYGPGWNFVLCGTPCLSSHLSSTGVKLHTWPFVTLVLFCACFQQHFSSVPHIDTLCFGLLLCFLTCRYSLDNNIKFTAENTRADGSIPFLDTLVTPKSDGSLQTKVYRKPTHTNQYLQWDSHHAMSNTYSVISSLLHRAIHICSSQELLEEEQKEIQEALSICKYPTWAHQQNEN